MKNYDEDADAVKLFYGNETGDKYSDLIKEHFVIAASLVEAAKAENNTAFADADKNWFKKAEEIATFESTINPNSKLQERVCGMGT